MRKFYSSPSKLIAVFILSVFLNNSSRAQTFTTAGDIAFTGYLGNGPTGDAFSFVVLKNITAGSTLLFTDNGWTGSAFIAAGENVITWTAGSNIPPGREIRISGIPLGTATAVFAGNGSSAGGVSGVMPSFQTAGDQILAYVTSPSMTFIAGLHMNQYCTCLSECGTTATAGWDPAACITVSLNPSAMPTGLTSGSTAVWIGISGTGNTDFDNAKFNCTGDLSSAASVRAAINNYNPGVNWTGENGVATITLPCNCSFMGLAPLPVKLESFTGKLNSDKTVTLQWKVALQQGINEYIVEESTDGATYSYLGRVPSSQTDNYTYSFIDQQVAVGNNYYRLKTMEQDGKHAYSDVILINLKAGIKVNAYPNPVTDKLTIQQFGTIQYKTAILSDGQGRVLQQIMLSKFEQEIDMSKYSAGLYVLKMEDGTVFKIIKQ